MDHNKIIAEKAIQHLKPLGYKRIGKSRLWIKDKGWWAILVEFQPSQWSSGTYINVSASTLLYEYNAWQMHTSTRIQGFASANDDPDFQSKVDSMTKEAAECATEMEINCSDLSYFVKVFTDFPENRKSVWHYYYAGILNSILGNCSLAKQCYTYVAEREYEHLFEQAIKLSSAELEFLIEFPDQYKSAVLGIVLRARQVKNLDGFNLKNFSLPWASNA